MQVMCKNVSRLRKRWYTLINYLRACLKNHSRKMCVTICKIDFFKYTLEYVKNKFDIRTGMVIPENGVKLFRRHIYVFSSWPGKSRETV